MSFASMKSRRGNINTAKLVEEINKIDPSSKKRTDDDRFWKPTTDKVGNGYAVIRFLPAREEEDLVVPFVAVYDHGFQGPSGKWYIENSLTTLGKDDPVSEYNQKLWNSGLESDKEQARKQKRRLHYIANIYIVKDPGAPQNEGQVKLFRFGAKIYQKIKDAMNPPEGFEDETPIIPYDFWEGANFKLKIRKVEGYSNYDTSSFDDPSPLSEDDDKLEKIYNQLHSLKAFIDPDGKDHNGFPLYKSYDELKAKLYKVLDLELPSDTSRLTEQERRSPANSSPSVSSNSNLDNDAGDDISWSEPRGRVEEPEISSGNDEDEDDTLDYFRRLAEGN